MTTRDRALEGGIQSPAVPEIDGEPRGNIWRRDGGRHKLSAWMDADHVTCPDTRRSVSGGLVTLRGGAISWFSRARRVTATATPESEYVALVEIVNELHFLRLVKAFMVPPIDYNVRVHEDNEGAIKMTENSFHSRRTRHIDVKHHNMVRDALDGGIIRVEYVKTGEQHADVLTKAVRLKSTRDSC